MLVLYGKKIIYLYKSKESIYISVFHRTLQGTVELMYISYKVYTGKIRTQSLTIGVHKMSSDISPSACHFFFQGW